MSAGADDLRGLLARVLGATRPDREIDEAVHFALLPNDPWGNAILAGRALVANGQSGADVHVPGVSSRMTAWGWAKCARVPAVTASLDAAVALVEASGFAWQVDQHDGCILSDGDDCYNPVKAATPPLSVCAALLTAMIMTR